MKKDIELINLSTDEFKNLKKVGCGTDGKVFSYTNKILLKIYRENLTKIKKMNELMNKEDKIYERGSLRKIKFDDPLTYFAYDGSENIRLRSIDALKKAVIKQKHIKRTNLPKGIVKIDNNFAGCIIEKANGTQIHKLTGMPLKYKYKIIKNLLLDVEELLNNNVYHVDLSNSPYAKVGYIDEDDNFKFMNGHSHVLVNPISLKTNIIDLDGKSTKYMERYNEKAENECLYNLCLLLIEFLYKIDTDEIRDIDEIIYRLKDFNLDNDFAQKLANNKFNNIEEIKKGLNL